MSFDRAVDRGAHLYESVRDAFGYLRHVRSARALWRVVAPAPPLVLNAPASASTCLTGVGAAELAARLRMAGHALALEALDGPLRASSGPEPSSLAAIEALVPALHLVTPESLPSDAERVAFFLNLYNVLVLHGAAALGVRTSVLEEPTFFSAVAYRVGDAILTPDRIEHGILRRDAPHLGRRTLRRDDPARAFLPRVVEPRIHAALVCASASCPPIAFYDPERLHEQLDRAARHLVSTHVRVARDVVRLPLVFRHYARDFEAYATRDDPFLPRGVREFVSAHAEPPLRAAVTAARRARYDPWDWRFGVSVRES